MKKAVRWNINYHRALAVPYNSRLPRPRPLCFRKIELPGKAQNGSNEHSTICSNPSIQIRSHYWLFSEAMRLTASNVSERETFRLFIPGLQFLKRSLDGYRIRKSPCS